MKLFKNRKLICILCAAALVLGCGYAQAASDPTEDAGTYLERYKLLTSHVGDGGMGVQTLLDKWEKAAPGDVNMMVGRFNWCIAKSTRDTLIKKPHKNHLGLKPLLSLKDSTGVVWYYFNEPLYDDDLFAQGLKWIEKAIAAAPDAMEYQVAKGVVLSSYEKGNPDMALSYVQQIIDSRFKSGAAWTYNGAALSAEDFDSVIQDFCVTYYRTATEATYEAFRILSEKMLKYEKGNVLFLDNLGSYWLVVKKNYSKAKKYYSQALKAKPDDATAKTNMEILHKMEAAGKANKK